MPINNNHHLSNHSLEPLRGLTNPYIKAEPILPIVGTQQTLEKLEKNSLITPFKIKTTLKEKGLEKLNADFSWEVAKIHALFNAIYQEGVANENDLVQLVEFSEEIDELERTLPKPLNNDQTHYLAEAKKAIEETSLLAKALQQFYPLQDKLAESSGTFIDRYTNPLFPGEALLATTDLKNCLSHVMSIQKEISSLSEGSAEKIRLEKFLKDTIEEFSSLIPEWANDIQKSVEVELKYLKNEIHSKPETDTCFRQLKALYDKQEEMVHDISLLKLPQEPIFNSLSSSLQEALEAINTSQAQIAEFCKKHKTELNESASLKYGDAEWVALIQQRPAQQKGFIEKVVGNLMHPENWSDQTKQLVYLGLTGMQLSQQAIEVNAKLASIDLLKKQADHLQDELLKNIPEKTLKIISKDVALLENLLSDRYEMFKGQTDKERKTFAEKLTHRNPNILQPLLQAIENFETKPSNEQIQGVRDAYQINAYMQHVSKESPFAHLNFETWWEIFTKPEQDSAPQVIQNDFNASAVVTSSASRTSGWASSLIKTVGGFIPSPSHSDYETLAICQTNLCMEELKDAVTNLQETHSYVQNKEQLADLQTYVSLLYRELIKISEEVPSTTSSLLELATWAQAVHDKCYSVKSLEEEIDALMEPTRHALSIDNKELEKYGKKHENLIKMAQVTETLKLPAVTVPIPDGIQTEAIESFLKTNAPDVFDKWQTLGQLYNNYKGTTPFLESPEAKAALEAIDKGILNAFEKASKDETLYQNLMPAKLLTFLETVKANGNYLMVRSTGAEDSRQTANAGGNVSKAYVSPEQSSFSLAIGDVVRSYFGYGSLQNRINAGINPFENELKLAVTTQELVGEPVGGSTLPQDIPISLVLFSSEPLYVGGEKFRVMRISAAYGHGEGVVGNQGIDTDTALLLISETHPDRLYVVYENHAKNERLAPIATENGIHLEKIANPPELINKPALTPNLLNRLYHLGIVMEKFFDDKATDMEIVIKGKTIYPVQARPVIRPDLLPTYLDSKKIATLESDPILKKLQGDVLITGRGSVVIASSAEEIIFANTLEEAEKMFHKDKGQKIVLVMQPEPENSHPVVNFSSVGMPSLVVKDGEKAKEILESVNANTPLVVDMQTGVINQWDVAKGNPEESISNGFVTHPAKMALSLNLVKGLPVPDNQSTVPQEIKELILAINSATTKDVALAKLQELKQHGWIKGLNERKKELETHLKDLKIVPKKVGQTYAVFEELDKRIEEVFEEAASAFKRSDEADRLRPLIHIKTLENLLFAPTKGRSLSQYSLLDIEPLHKQAEALIDYQKRLSHPAHLDNLLSAGSKALDPSMQKEWGTFLEELEPLIENGTIPKEKAKQLKQLVKTLEKSELLTPWLNLFFSHEIQKQNYFSARILSSYRSLYETEDARNQRVIEEKLEDVLATFPLSEAATVQKFLERTNTLKDQKEHIERFGRRAQFDAEWETLQKEGGQLLSSQGLNDLLKNASPSTRLLIQKSMTELVDVFDKAIKTIKMSSEWTPEEKTKLFKQMLKPYLDLLLDWGNNVIDQSTIPMHQNWNIPRYLDKMLEIFNKLPDSNPEQMNPSRGNSVAAAMLGAVTEFESHLPGSLEDMFTLIHQNLLMCISSLGKDIYSENAIQDSSLPQSLKAAIAQCSSSVFDRRLQRTAIEMTDQGVAIRYNIPLRNHSAQMLLNYDKVSGETTLKGFLFGEALVRWKKMEVMAKILDKAGVLPLSEPIRLGENEVIFSWKIDKPELLSTALKEFNEMCEISLGVEGTAITSLIQRWPQPSVLESAMEILTQKENMMSSEPFVYDIYLEKARLKLSLSETLSKKEIQNCIKFILINQPDALLKAYDSLSKESIPTIVSNFNIKDELKPLINLLLVKIESNPELLPEAIKTLFFNNAASGISRYYLRNNIFSPMFNKIAKEGLRHKDQNIREVSGQVLVGFQDQMSIPELKELIAITRLDSDNIMRYFLLNFFTQIVDRNLLRENYSVDDTYEFISKGMEAEHFAILNMTTTSLIIRLIEKNYELEKFPKILLKALLNPQNPLHPMLLQAFLKLVEKNYGLKEAVEAFEKGIINSAGSVRFGAEALGNKLIEKGYEIDKIQAILNKIQGPAVYK